MSKNHVRSISVIFASFCQVAKPSSRPGPSRPGPGSIALTNLAAEHPLAIDIPKIPRFVRKDMEIFHKVCLLKAMQRAFLGLERRPEWNPSGLLTFEDQRRDSNSPGTHFLGSPRILQELSISFCRTKKCQGQLRGCGLCLTLSLFGFLRRNYWDFITRWRISNLFWR